VSRVKLLRGTANLEGPLNWINTAVRHTTMASFADEAVLLRAWFELHPRVITERGCTIGRNPIRPCEYRQAREAKTW
jgi:hypothetical protein